MAVILCCPVHVTASVLSESSVILDNAADSVVQSYEEDASLRSVNTKHFHYGNGGYIAALYTDPVHYLDEDGQWQDIDNTLILNKPSLGDKLSAILGIKDDLLNVAYYENKANDFKVRLPQYLKSDAPVQVDYEGYSISFSPISALQLNSVAETEGASAATKKAALLLQAAQVEAEGDYSTGEELRKEAAVMLTDKVSSLSYTDVFANTTLEYEINGQKLKENIIIEKPTTKTSFSFELTFENLEPVEQDFGAVYFYAENQEDPCFVIQAPYMEDSGADDDLSMDIEVDVERTSTGCIYTITPNKEWLQSPDRVYPITIDPTLTTPLGSSVIQDNGVNQYNPTTNFMTVDRMYVGSHLASGTAYENRIYIRFPRITEIPTSAYIHRAKMYLNQHATTSYQSASNNQINVYDVGSNNWNTNTITWNSQKNYSLGARVDYQKVSSPSSDALDEFDITSLVRTWYKTTASNNGVVLRPNKVYTDKDNRVCYYSSDCSSSLSGKRPRVQVEYFVGEQTAGISNNMNYFLRSKYSDKYMSVSKNSLGNGSAVYQSDYTGDTNQRWRVLYVGGGVYRFISQQNPSLQLDVPNANDADGQNLQVHEESGYSAQLFRIISNGDGTYRIIAALASGTRVLDVEGPSQANGTPIQIWTWCSNVNQRWYFELVNFGCAWAFRNMPKGDPNCFGYALGVMYSPDLPYQSGNSVSVVAQKVETWVSNHGGEIRQIDGPTSSINNNEYRFCMRVASTDCHFWVQTDTGAWAEKNGTSNVLHLPVFVHPSLASWNLGMNPNYTNYYDSDTVYFATTKIKDWQEWSE